MDRQIVENNKILEIRVGSHLYGLNRPESDEDFSGVFIAPASYYFGLDKVEEVDLSVVSKLANGRNASDAIDRKFFEIRKFVKLAMDCNPNIIEQLFVTPANIIHINELGLILLNNRFMFLHKGLKDRFIGYAISQKKKMFVKRDNMKHIEYAITLLKALRMKSYMAEHIDYLLQFEDDDRSKIFKDAGNQHIQCGDIHLQKNITVDRALEQLEERKSKFSGRKEMVDEYGYDTKFAMHLIRLLLEGEELLGGDMTFPLKDTELLKDIRNGKFSMAEVDEMATEIEDRVNVAFEKSPLPNKPRYNDINNLLMNITYSYFQGANTCR